MRNSQAQRYARWSATVAFLLAAIVCGVYLRGVWVAKQAAKKAPPAVPAAVEQRSNEFSYSKVEGQRTLYTVKASRTTEFKEGSRNLLEDVSISVFGKRGERNDTLRTKACDFISSTGKISCAGEVQISLQAGGAAASAKPIQVTTSGISFDRDSGLARTDKPVTFRWPAGEGRAVGVQYDSNEGTLRLEHSVELTLSPATSKSVSQGEASPAQGPVAPEKAVGVTGDSMLFHREQRTVQLLGSVHAVQTTHELTTDSLLLDLDTAFHVKHLTASGHPRMIDTDAQSPMTLDADEISATLMPDGAVESIVATGNVHGSRKSSAGEHGIEAGLLQVNLATRQNVPRLLTASGKVALTSNSSNARSGTRRVESESLEIHFTKNSVPGQVLMETVNTLAPARIEWQDMAMLNGKPAKQTMRMRGDRMNLQFAGQNQIQQLIGTGGVGLDCRIWRTDHLE